MRETRSDEVLMLAVQAGDPDAYTELFARYRAPIYGYALRLTRQPELAEDVFQDTFLNVHRARAAWSPSLGTFRAWLYRIATNAAHDRARRSQRRPEVLTDDVVLTHLDPQNERIDLERAVAALPDTLREAFMLGVVEGLDHQEVAAALEISPDNARARITRARSRLRELLEAQ